MPAEAGVEILNPYTGIVWKGGETEQIKWQDNNQAPLLSTLTNLVFELMAGTQDTQFPVAQIANNVQGSSLSLTYTVPANLGPQGSFYFIRVTQPSSSYTAYSADFEIDNINGTIPNFNPSNPGTPLTSTTADASSTASSSSTPSSSANVTTTASAHKTNSALSSTDSSSQTSSDQLVTAASATSNGSGSTSTPSPQSKSSSNKLAINVYVLSLALLAMSFYLY
ncbi:14130_t:CDS:2 [Acaulospora colombiana]|uniref:14130_t:CDS:1 n=1 Tax=Acaulospora colombiana TaxID=27376 RepID=A0ACA9LRI3_9GLOM|nr:14130_t:CDS:2 [Acaulospora colombiana]